MRKKVISVLLGVALLTGCATMSDEARTKGEGTAVGAGVGAALGAGLGALLGGRQGALLGAGLGAAVGAGGGYLYGSHVANRKKDYARQEDYLNALVVSAQQVNDRTDALRQEIAQLETETAQRIEQYNQRTVQKSALKKQERILATKIEEGQKQLRILQTEIDVQQQALAQEQQTPNKSQEATARLKNLQVEINRLEGNKTKLDNDVKRLAAIQIRPTA